MTIIPVLDVRDGQAVLADARVGGRRHYRPVHGRLHAGSDPLGLALSYRDRLGLPDLYLADLDALDGSPRSLPLYRDLARLGSRLWIDAGIREADDAPPILEAGAAVIVLGLETLRGPDALAATIARCGPDRCVFSLDLHEGRPVVETERAWGTADPRALASDAVARGVLRLIVLDLARVGRGDGIGTLPLVAALREAHPGLEIIVGGGVSGPDDLDELEAAGAAAVLVGSALHDGRIGPGRGLGTKRREDESR